MVDAWRCKQTVYKKGGMLAAPAVPLKLGHGAPSSLRRAGTKIRALPWEMSGDEVLRVEGI
jgi:hypothetical protein